MDAPLLPVLPGYDNPELIAHGTTALVFRATQTRLNRSVAIKVITADTGSIPVNAERELATTVALSSQPHIVSIIDTGVTSDDRPYIVMEYCEGGSYAQILKSRGPLPVDDVLEVGVKIGEALHAAHTVGIVHRDVKPSNILRSRFGPALTDFGIARAPDELGSTLTREMMTPHHASPEALLHQAQSGLSDVYSLASTLWTLLIGHPPFVDPTRPPLDMHAFRDRVLHDPLPAMPREDVPAWLVRELGKAMSKLPSSRHGSAFELAEALRRGSLGLDPTPPPAVDLSGSVHMPGLPSTAWPLTSPTSAPVTSAPVPAAPASPWATFATGVREPEPAEPQASSTRTRPDPVTPPALPLFAEPEPPADEPEPVSGPPVRATAPVSAPAAGFAPPVSGPPAPVSDAPLSSPQVSAPPASSGLAPLPPLRPLEPLAPPASAVSAAAPAPAALAPLFAEPAAPLFAEAPTPLLAEPIAEPAAPLFAEAPAPLLGQPATPLVFAEPPVPPSPASAAPAARVTEFATRPAARPAPVEPPAQRTPPVTGSDEGGWQSASRASTVEVPPPAPRIVVSDVDSPHRSRRGVLIGALVGLVSIALIVAGVLVVVGLQHRGSASPPSTQPSETGTAQASPTVSPNVGEPGGPTNVAIADHGTSITVSWADPTPSHTVSFVVTMSSSASTEFQSQTLVAGTTSATFTGLSRTAKYCVQVVALYGISNAPRSAIVCTTPTRT